jgi:hypothetical protein
MTRTTSEKNSDAEVLGQLIFGLILIAGIIAFIPIETFSLLGHIIGAAIPLGLAGFIGIGEIFAAQDNHRTRI